MPLKDANKEAKLSLVRANNLKIKGNYYANVRRIKKIGRTRF